MMDMKESPISKTGNAPQDLTHMVGRGHMNYKDAQGDTIDKSGDKNSFP